MTTRRGRYAACLLGCCVTSALAADKFGLRQDNGAPALHAALAQGFFVAETLEVRIRAEPDYHCSPEDTEHSMPAFGERALARLRLDPGQLPVAANLRRQDTMVKDAAGMLQAGKLPLQRVSGYSFK